MAAIYSIILFFLCLHNLIDGLALLTCQILIYVGSKMFFSSSLPFFFLLVIRYLVSAKAESHQSHIKPRLRHTIDRGGGGLRGRRAN